MNNNKIKIAMVLRMLGYGGAERQVVELCQALNKNKYDITVVLFFESEGHIEELKKAGISVVVLSTLQRYKADILFKLISHFRKESYDVVYTWLPIVNFIGGLACKLSFTSSKIIGSMRNANRFVMRDIFCLFDYVAFHLFAHHIIANSNAGAKILINQYRLPQHKVSMIRNGRNFSSFKPSGIALREQWGIQEGDVVITTIGRVARQKAQHVLVMAINQLKKNNPHRRIKCLIVGKEEDNAQKVKEMIAEHHLEQDVKLVGGCTYVADVLNVSDIFVSCSLWEGTPNVVMEAMYAQVPVIVSDIEPHREVIDDGADGFLFRVGDKNDLSEKINALLGQRDKIEEIVFHAKKKMTDQFNQENMGKKYNYFFDQLL